MDGRRISKILIASCGSRKKHGRGLAAALILAGSAHAACGQSLPDVREIPESKHVDGTVAAQLHRIPMQLASHSSTGVASDLATPDVLRWIDSLIRDNLPPTYKDDRKWNQQKEVWNGIKLRREGLRVETERRKKLVNSGTWTRYEIALVEPDKNLSVQFQRLEALPDGKVAFAVSVDCALDAFGRLSQWVRDVQVISLSANADAACRLWLEGTVQLRVNPLKFPPDVSLHPEVSQAQVELTYYRVRRISQIGGDFAKVLGNGLRGVVDEKLEDMNAKLVTKINQQLDKHHDKLTFSAQEWLRAKVGLPAVQPIDVEIEER